MDIKPCPRCRAERRRIDVIMQDDYGVCPRCGTTWQQGKNGVMVSIPKENNDRSHEA